MRFLVVAALVLVACGQEAMPSLVTASGSSPLVSSPAASAQPVNDPDEAPAAALPPTTCPGVDETGNPSGVVVLTDPASVSACASLCPTAACVVATKDTQSSSGLLACQCVCANTVAIGSFIDTPAERAYLASTWPSVCQP